MLSNIQCIKPCCFELFGGAKIIWNSRNLKSLTVNDWQQIQEKWVWVQNNRELEITELKLGGSTCNCISIKYSTLPNMKFKTNLVLELVPIFQLQLGNNIKSYSFHWSSHLFIFSCFHIFISYFHTTTISKYNTIWLNQNTLSLLTTHLVQDRLSDRF